MQEPACTPYWYPLYILSSSTMFVHGAVVLCTHSVAIIKDHCTVWYRRFSWTANFSGGVLCACMFVCKGGSVWTAACV